MQPTLTEAQLFQLREQHYNATVVDLLPAHEDLIILRVQPDAGVFPFISGQYTTLGLGRWEERMDNVPRGTKGKPDQLLRRAYSISFPLLDDDRQLLPPGAADFLEFYVALVRKPNDDPPSLTPRLFALKPGDRLAVGSKAYGTYTLEPVQDGDNVLLLSTGTGEAPHNAMVADLLTRGHAGRIISAVCVRYLKDLAYLEAHRELEQRYSNYRYLPLTTREPFNLDSSHPDFVGKQYLQDYFQSGRLKKESGGKLDPRRTHVFLCGNPAMIGPPRTAPDDTLVYPEPTGMVELLTNVGFILDQPNQPGNVHFEKYW